MIKKKIGAILLSAFMTISTLAFSTVTAKADSVNGWQQNGAIWNYYINGTKATANWVSSNGKWYYLNTNGDMATGWVTYNSKWYYLNNNGDMAVSTTTPDGYVVDITGAWNGQAITTPVATVNGETITKAQLDARMVPVITQMQGQNIDPSSDQGKQTIADQKKQIVNIMVMEKIIVQKANELKIMPDEVTLTESVNKKIEDIKKGFADTKGVVDDSKYKAALVQAGFTEISLSDDLRLETIKAIVKDYIIKDVSVDDVKAKAEYDANPLKYTTKPDTIHVAHILVKTEDEAIAVKKRLDNNEDFATVAKAVSIDNVANENGGDLGDIPYINSGMDQTFMTAAMALNPGMISNPIHTQFGFHVIKCIDKKEYPAQNFEDIKEEIKTALLETEKTAVLNDTLDKWKKAANIEIGNM